MASNKCKQITPIHCLFDRCPAVINKNNLKVNNFSSSFKSVKFNNFNDKIQ